MKKNFLLWFVALASFCCEVVAQCPPPGFPAAGDSCPQAPTLCADLNGYCDSTDLNNVNQPFPGCPANALNNDEWFGFIAGTPTISIQIVPTNCQGTNGQFGIQSALYEGSCTGPAIATQCGCTTNPFTMTANFQVGQVYYIVIDGCAGDICDYQVNILSGSAVPTPPQPPSAIQGPLLVCPGATTTYTVPNPAANYAWTLTPPIGTISNSPPADMTTINWTSPGNAQLCVTANNPCYPAGTAPVCISITSAIIPPTPEVRNLCVGDCVPCAGQQFCAPGLYPVTLQSYLGCDSVINCQINAIPPVINNLGQVTFCSPHTYSICGTNFFESGIISHVCEGASYLGCDSTVLIDLAILNPDANIIQPGVLGCGSGATVILDGTGSNFSIVPGGNTTFLWTGPGIVGNPSDIVVLANAPGQYCLTVTSSRDGVVCTSSECVTVTQNSGMPMQPQISGNQMPCQGTSVNYTVTPVGAPAPTGYTWTTPNGETVTNVNATTVSVLWSTAMGGQLCVTANNACGSSSPACIPITVTPTPAVPVVTGPPTVCANSMTQAYSVVGPQTGVTYTWTVPTGASFTGSGSSINVNFSGATPGAGQVCVTAMNACGTSMAGCAPVTITSPPTLPVLNGPTNVCSSGGNYNYSVATPQVGVNYNWTAPPNATITGTGSSVQINFLGATTGQVCVTGSTSCGDSQPACQTVTVVPAPVATISGMGSFCAGSGDTVALNITLTGTAPWTVGYSNSAGGTGTLNIPSSPYIFNVTAAGTYTLTSLTGGGGACPGTVQGSGTATQNPSPTAALTGGGSICAGSGDQVGLNVNLTGSPNWTVNYTINGTAVAPAVFTSNPGTINIGQNQAGSVVLTGVTDGNGCVGTASGTSTVTVINAPTVSLVHDSCNAVQNGYYVIFTVNGGVPASYSVTPNTGSFSGNVYTSGLIPTGSGYSFVVTDGNNCNPITVDDNIVVCDCATSTGDMDLAEINECGDGPVTAPYDNTDENLDPNDVLVYILHNGSGVSIVPPILGEFATPEVSFGPGMTYGTTYYLSAVAGDDDGTGSPDPDDPCYIVSQGTPITFSEIPTAVLSGDPSVCVGSPANLTVEFTGEAPYSISYDGGATVQTVNGINAQNYTLVVNPTTTTTYCLTAMNDQNCPGDESGCATATVLTGVQIQNLTVECNTTNTAYTVSFTIAGGDPTSYLVTGVTGTITGNVFTSNPIPTGSGFDGIVTDANDCAPKVFSQTEVICECETNAGQMSSTPVTLCGDGPIDVAATTGDTLDADDILVYILHTNAGTLLGTQLASSSTPSFSFDPATMTYGDTYYVSAVVGSDDGTGAVNQGDPCLAVSAGTPIVFFEIPTAGIEASQEICPGETASLTIDLTGVSPWTVTINGQPVSGIIGTPYTYNVTPVATTTYLMTDVMDKNCLETVSDSVTVTVHNPPTVANIEETCNGTNTAYVVCFDIIGGDPTGYQVTPATGTITGNQFCSDEITSGAGYLFQVTDGHGCPAEIVEKQIFECNCFSMAGDMEPTAISVCGNNMTAPAPYLGGEMLDADDVLCYILHNGNNQPLATNATGQFNFLPSMTYGQQYFINAVVGNAASNGCVDLTNDPCVNIGEGVPITFHAIPTAVLSGGGNICAGQSANLTVTLTGAGPWTISYQNAAGNPVTVTANASPFTIMVSPAASNVYSLTSVMGAFCPGTVSGNATVNVSSPPESVNETVTCSPTNTTYVVTFEIIGGNSATYSVLPAGSGTIAGGMFTSNPIPSGQSYNFTLNDANNCSPATISGMFTCNCDTDAGNMATTLTNICVGETAVVAPTTGQVLDPDDVLVYVLHTNAGTTVGTILATNTVPEFDFIPGTMTVGVQYFISAYVGNSNGAGGISPTDPCRDLAAGTPVIFRPLPTINISGTTSICEGDDATFTITTTGSGPFNVAFTQDGLPQTITIPTAGTFPITLTPPATTSVTLVSITDNPTGCSNTSTASATVTVNTAVDAGTTIDNFELCENDNQQLDLFSQLQGADAGGVWTGPGGNVTGGTINAATLAPGTFIYTYTLDAVAPCQDDQATVEVVVQPQPVADAGPDQNLTCLVDEVPVGVGNPVAGVTYTWTGGTVADPATIQSSVIEPGTYTLTASTTFGCSDKDDVVITQNITKPEPHISVSDVSCFGDSDGYVAVDSITQGLAPYLCSFDGGPFTQQKQFLNLGPGTHTILIQDAAGCERTIEFTVGEPEEVQVEIFGNFDENNEPIIELGETLVLSLLVTPPYNTLDTVVWTPTGIDSCSNCPDITIMPSEQTTYSVMVEKNGCRDSDNLTVFVKKVRPVYVPNAFSPNEDGINDFFNIFAGPQVSNIKSFIVFNRWGETVYEYYDFQPNDPAIGWDGRHRGKFANPTVYTWFAEVEFVDGEVEIFKGDVTVIR